MSCSQWGHGYHQGLKDAVRTRGEQREADGLLRGLCNPPYSDQYGVISDNNSCVLLPCPFHYVLSTWTGEVYQTQDPACLLSIDAGIIGRGAKYPFLCDCRFYGDIFMLTQALCKCYEDNRRMRKEASWADKGDFEFLHPEGHFLPLKVFKRDGDPFDKGYCPGLLGSFLDIKR